MTEGDSPAESCVPGFVDAMGLFFEEYGVPRIGGRMLALLMLAERPMSLDGVARALRVSRASVSTNARLVLATGLIERASVPGDRRDYYVFSRDAWSHALETEMKGLAAIRRITEQGLDEIAADNAVGRERLRAAMDFAGFYEDVLRRTAEEWRERTTGRARRNGQAP
jgi:DNA-binding transcriptional regulator GbsR (MarR family)